MTYRSTFKIGYVGFAPDQEGCGMRLGELSWMYAEFSHPSKQRGAIDA